MKLKKKKIKVVFEFLVEWDTVKAERRALAMAKECDKNATEFTVHGISSCKLLKRKGQIL